MGQNFLYHVVVLLCLTRWSDALTSLIHLVFYFISKAPWKKIFLGYTESHQGEFAQSSFIPVHQISHRTVEIANIRTLIYTKNFKLFLNLWNP